MLRGKFLRSHRQFFLGEIPKMIFNSGLDGEARRIRRNDFFNESFFSTEEDF